MAATFDPTKYTLGEIAKIEDLSQMSIEQIGEDSAPKGKLLAALVFVEKRRQGDPIKWPDCLAMSLEDASAVLGTGEDEPEPAETGPGDEAPKARASRAKK